MFIKKSTRIKNDASVLNSDPTRLYSWSHKGFSLFSLISWSNPSKNDETRLSCARLGFNFIYKSKCLKTHETVSYKNTKDKEL